MQQQYLDPAILAGISGLDLVAKTVVQGFIAGLHRSPDYGFSQEFAEYRAYTPGDDLRSVDWNVFARTDRFYLKRYRGETNTQITVVLDASGSMAYGSDRVTKLEYAKFLAASLCYLAAQQRDAAGLIVFDDEVRLSVPPASRQGQLSRLLHGIESASPGARTEYGAPFLHMQNLLHRRGIVALISDFYIAGAELIRTVEPLAFRGSELILFHVLDAQEIAPKFRDAVSVVDLETKDSIDVTPEYATSEYPSRIESHIQELRQSARNAGMDYFLLRTDRPLDEALREYLMVREGRP